MNDLYAEVMAILHDTGAFARWQQDERMRQAVQDAKRRAEDEGLRFGAAATPGPAQRPAHGH